MEHVEVARASSERGEVVLLGRRDPDAPDDPDGPDSPVVLELRVNGVFVMDSHETSSEVALAQRALAEVERPRSVLVGGLGLGHTVHEVLSDRRVEHVVVAELEEALVGWFRDGTIPHGPAYLADQRLSISVGDVRQVVAESPPAAYDLVLLDVDNGPDFLVHEENAAIYREPFLRQVREALRVGGVLVFWSSTESPALARAVENVFGGCRTTACPVVLQGHEDTYWLHSGQRCDDDDQDPPPKERT